MKRTILPYEEFYEAVRPLLNFLRDIEGTFPGINFPSTGLSYEQHFKESIFRELFEPRFKSDLGMQAYLLDFANEWANRTEAIRAQLEKQSNNFERGTYILCLNKTHT